MSEEKESKISYWAAHLTTIISVTMVLIIIGLIALVSISAGRETDRLREQIELSAVMQDSISDAEASELAAFIKAQPYCLTVETIGKNAAMKNWTEDTGVNLEELYGVNPLSPEVSFTIKSEYADAASIAKIADQIKTYAGVEDVAVPDASMISAMNENIEKMTYLLGGIALVMIIISFILINNTVRLTIYSRRFTIHTMQLVGATRGFIRKPFIINNMLSGLIAGLIADAILVGAMMLTPYLGVEDVEQYVSSQDFCLVCGALIAAGMLICAVAAALATTHYLSKEYDELFK
ncbi:MAG: permease-like cell division protein FtsX [Prevotella sp.]|nr:permease-like cell division protein FtsX [Bacteroides sp.]MCM1366192.1 permease-like cell division protein FtsX [Prevotella sp.]MCM1436944.1 permease-like cell division protein FtsX [Prevotella sp.]